MQPTVTATSTRRRMGGVAFALCLSLGACSSFTSDWRAGVPLPPAEPIDFEQARHTGPVLASQFFAPRGLATKPEPAPERSTEGDLIAFFEHWREAWMTGNFKAYIRYYAPAFSGNDTSSLRWQLRRLRMVQGKSAEAQLRLGPPTVEIEGDGQARISFLQDFQDAGLTETGTKQWQLRRIDGRWLIAQEIFERRDQ
jgi:hypothetical protein